MAAAAACSASDCELAHCNRSPAQNAARLRRVAAHRARVRGELAVARRVVGAAGGEEFGRTIRVDERCFDRCVVRVAGAQRRRFITVVLVLIVVLVVAAAAVYAPADLESVGRRRRGVGEIGVGDE